MEEGSDRRRHKRLPGGNWARVSCRRVNPAGGPDLAVGLLDISPAGVGLRLNGPVEPGEELIVEVEGEALPAPVRATGVVRWVIQQETGTCTAGVAFYGPLAEQDVWALSRAWGVAPPTEPGAEETRPS